MFEVTCFNSNGESVTHLTQWDQGQSLFLEDTGLAEAPEFHFCNRHSTEAFVVPSSMSADGTISVKVPNELLKQPCSIIAYVYLYENAASGDPISAKTLYTITLPVRPRPKPSDYTYVENIDRITLAGINDEITEILGSLNTLNNDVIGLKENKSDVLHTHDGRYYTEAEIDTRLKNKQDYFSSAIDLSGSEYNRSKYYPVTGSPIPEDGMHLIKVCAHPDSSGNPEWAKNGFESNLEILDSKNGYGMCLNSYARYANGTNPAGYLQMRASGTPVITLRGGGKYFVYTDFGCEWTVRTKEHTVSGETVQPIDSRTLRFEKTVIMANLSGDVTGNVTGNVDGTLNGCTLAKSVPADAKFTDTVYTHPTTSGNKHIPSGGSAGQILRWGSAGTAVWDTYYTNAEIDTKVSILEAQIEELAGIVNNSGGAYVLEPVTPSIIHDGHIWEPEGSGALLATQSALDAQCVAFPVTQGERYKIQTYCSSGASHPVYGGLMGEDPTRIYEYKEMAVPVMDGTHSYFVTVPAGILYLGANSDNGEIAVYKCILQE